MHWYQFAWHGSCVGPLRVLWPLHLCMAFDAPAGERALRNTPLPICDIPTYLCMCITFVKLGANQPTKDFRTTSPHELGVGRPYHTCFSNRAQQEQASVHKLAWVRCGSTLPNLLEQKSTTRASMRPQAPLSSVRFDPTELMRACSLILVLVVQWVRSVSIIQNLLEPPSLYPRLLTNYKSLRSQSSLPKC